MPKRTVRDLDDLSGVRVFVRVDYNVPVKDGRIGDETRIRASLPTLEHLLEAGARIVLASHLGRPRKGPSPELSLAPVGARLSELIGRPVVMATDCVGADVQRLASALGDGGVLLLENVRFHPEEEKNDAAFAARLARLGEMYVNDAFGTAHRAHASTEAVAKLLKPAVAGFLVEKELEYLGRALEEPQRPFVAVLGGAKISGKIEVIEALLGRVNRLLIGGAMMFTFLKARGKQTGRSLVEEDRLGVARDLIEHAKKSGVELVLPVDCVVSEATDGSQPSRSVSVDALGASDIGVDIGPESLRRFGEALKDAKTVVWNGPMGIFEVPAFAAGTLGVAKAIAEAGGRGAVTVVGGGDSVAAVQASGLAEKFTHLSTGGGASLEFLEGKVLPGIAVLDDAEQG